MHYFSSGFTLKTVAQIGIQVLHRLEALHSIGFLHLDMQPDNVCLQEVLEQMDEDEIDNNLEINLIDFGISKRWQHNQDMTHLPK